MRQLVALRTTGSGIASGEIDVTSTLPVMRLDLIAGRADRFVRINGRVLDPAGTGIANVTIHVRGDTASARTGEAGRFTLMSLYRTSELFVRAVGWESTVVPVHPLRDSVRLPDVRLQRASVTLVGVKVTAEIFEREREGFEERRRGALGSFITDEMLERIPVISANVVASMAADVIVVSPPGSRGPPLLKLRRGGGFCSPRFFADGVDEGRLDLAEQQPRQWSLLRRAKRIEVYVANQAPARYTDFDGCGAVVVWTR